MTKTNLGGGETLALLFVFVPRAMRVMFVRSIKNSFSHRPPFPRLASTTGLAVRF